MHVKVPKLQQRSGWVVAQCPLGPWAHDGEDKNPSFAVKIGTEFANCFSCGFHGSLNELVETILSRNTNHPIQKYEIKKMKLILAEVLDDEMVDFDDPDIEQMILHGAGKSFVEFPQWWLDSFTPASEIKWAIEYLVDDRGLSPKMIDQLEIKADIQRKRVCFPVRDWYGKLMGLHGRAINADIKPRYLAIGYNHQYNPLIWYGEHWVDTEKPVIVVEGPFDVASVKRVYDNVVSPLYANPAKDKLRRMADAPEWVTLLDYGKAGDAGRSKIDKYLSDIIITHVKPPSKEKDAGAMTEDELRELLKDHVKLK